MIRNTNSPPKDTVPPPQAIIGGEFVDDNPGWIVSIHVPTFGYLGPGVILDNKTILTAAHVADNLLLVQTSVEIKAGSKFWNSSQQSINAANIYVHDLWPFPGDNPAGPDLAIIKLSSPLTFNDKVKPIELMRSCIFNSSELSPGKSITFYGWGAVSSNTPGTNASVLKFGQSTVIDLINSSFWTSEPFISQYFDPNHMIATYNPDLQTYYGDSGGPAVIERNGKTYLAGIISWGRDPNLSNNPNILYPSMFADVYRHLSFILSHVENNTFQCNFEGPTLSQNTGFLNCNETNIINLNDFYEGPVPTNYQLIWSTDNNPLDCITPVLTGIVSDFGTYYAYYYDPELECFSKASIPVVVQPQCQNVNELIITTNTTLSNSNSYSSIIVKNNSTLVIPQNVRINLQNEITVEQGSKIIVDGGILSNCEYCPKWKGIKAWGNPFFGQSHAVELKNGAVIEYAETGINTSNPVYGGIFGYFDLSGAKVTVENSTIRNCDVGINFGPFGFSGPYYGWEDGSYIKNSFFSDFLFGIRLMSNLGVEINNTDFTGNSTQCIEASNSMINVTGCNFEGYSGILLEAVWPNLEGSVITENNFFNITEGVLIGTQGNATEHVIGGNLFASGNGVASYGQSAFIIQNNEFADNEVGVISWITYNEDLNLVIDNNFNLNTYGSSVFGVTNLEFNDNCFENTQEVNIELYHNTSIFYSQGDDENSAGNCFTKSVPTILTGDNVEQFRYYIKSGTLSHLCRHPGLGNGTWSLENTDFENPLNCGLGIWGNIPVNFRNCVIPSTLLEKLQMEAAIKAEILRIKNDPRISSFLKKWLISRYERCLKLLIGRIAREIIRIPETGKEEAITYLNDQELFSHKIMAYAIIAESGELTRATSFLDNLTTSRNAESEFVIAQKIYLDFLHDGPNYILSAKDREILENIGIAQNELSGYARSIYYQLTGSRIHITIPHLEINKEKLAAQKNTKFYDISIYPNPAESDIINISLPYNYGDSNPELRLNDITGKSVLRKFAVAGENQIDISELSSGIYIISISNASGNIFTGRIIKI